MEILHYGWRLRVLWASTLIASNTQPKAQSHIGVYVFHTLRTGLVKFGTEDFHKNRHELQIDCSFEYNLALIKFSGNCLFEMKNVLTMVPTIYTSYV